MDEVLSPPKESPWTDERIELFRKLYRNGLSFSQIADQLGGGISRNSAIGKAHRLNFTPRAEARPRQSYMMSDYLPGARPEPKQARPTKNSPSLAPMKWNRPIAPKPKPAVRPAVLKEPKPLRLVNGRVTILHLSDKTCRWPIGEPGSKDFCFCGHSPRENSPYCEHHARAAYQPMQDRKHRSFA